MTAYTTHADALFDPSKPILGSTHLEARDNLISVTEGDSTAPKINLLALQKLVVGDSIRSRRENVAISTGADELIHSFTFLQSGDIRATVNRLSGGDQAMISRTRSGTETTIVALVAANIVTDVSVIPGDTINLYARSVSGVPSGASGYFSTDAAINLWPMPSGTVYVEGNSV